MSTVPMTQANTFPTDVYSTKVGTLQDKAQSKMTRLGAKANPDDYIKTEMNQYNPSELQYIMQYAADNRELSPEGNFINEVNRIYTGPTGRFYITGTNRLGQPEDEALRDLKPGYASGNFSLEDSYAKYPAGPEGVNLEDVRYNSLFPEHTARSIEALIKGNELARSQRVAPWLDEATNLANKERFGRGATEILARREDNTGAFGDASLFPELTEERKTELVKSFNDLESRMLRSVYPTFEGGTEALSYMKEAVDQQREQRQARQEQAADPNAMFSNLQNAMLKRESNGDYTVTNSLGYVGGYQFGAQALETLGYLKPGSSRQGNSALNNPSNWTGKNGLNSVDDFKVNPEAQDAAFKENAEFNFNQLNRLGVINDSSTDAEIGGYLAASHLLGAGGARNLTDQDAYGTSGTEYFEIGSNAVSTGVVDRDQPSLANKADMYMENRLREEAGDMNFFDRVVNAGSGAARTFTKEAAVDFADWVGEGLDSITGGVVGWDNGTEEEKTQMVNQWFGFNEFAAEEDYAQAKKHATNIVDAIYDEKKDIDINDAFQLIKIGVTTPEMLGDSVGFLASMFVPFLGWAGKASKGEKLTRPLRSIGRFAQRNAGLLQMSAGNVNDQIDAYKEEHGEAPSVAKVASMFATESVMLGLDRWTDLSILKAPNALKGVGEVFRTLPKGSKTQLVAKSLTAAGGLSINMGKEAAQEYLQEIGQEFNVQYNFDDNGDFVSALNEAGEVLLDKDMQVTGVTGAGLGAGGAVQFAAIGKVGEGVKSLGGKAVDTATKKVKEAKTTTGEDFTAVDRPAEEGFEGKASYLVDSAIVEGNTEQVATVVNSVKDVVTSTERADDLVGLLESGGMSSAKEAATVLGFDGDKKAFDTLVDKAHAVIGGERDNVELELTTAFAEAAELAKIEKADPELGKMLRQATMLSKGGQLSTNTDLVNNIREAALQSGDQDVINVASSVLGKAIPVPAEKRVEDETIEDIANKAAEVSEAKATTEDVVSEVEGKNYTLGSSKEAIEKIVELNNLEATNSKDKARVRSAIKNITENNNLNKNVVKLMLKDAATVESEATTGKGGYKSYGRMLKALEDSGRDEEVEIVRAKLNSFLDSQRTAAESLRDGIREAMAVTKEDNKDKVVTKFIKSNGQPFDIGINPRTGKAIQSQVDTAKDLFRTKVNNMKGIKEALGEPVTEKAPEEVVEEVAPRPEVVEPTPIVEQPVKEEAKVEPKPTKKPKTKKVDKPKEEPKKEAPKKPDMVAALSFAISSVEKGESDSDIISGLVAKGLSENLANRALEKAKKDEADAPVKPKQVMNDILKTSLYKAKKAFAVVKGKANLRSEEPTRGTTGVIQRNPTEYVRVARETTLNTVSEFNDAITGITEKAKNTLESIIKPLHRYEKDLNAYGALESVDSPSRGLLFNSDKELNDNVVLAIRAALTDSLVIDKDLYSGVWKDKDEVARMFGMTNSNDVSKELWELTKDKGLLLDTAGNSLGDKIASLLGLVEGKDASDIQNFARLKADLGGAAIQMAVADGLLEFITIPAPEFAAAMGEQALSDKALVNFVRFKNEESTLKSANKEFDTLKEGIPEIDEGRPEPFLDGVPSDIIKKRTANYHNGKVGLTPSITHQKALKELMNTEWEFDRELAQDLLDNEEAFLKFAGYIAEDSVEFDALSYNDKQGQKGKNRKVLSDLEAIKDVVKGTKGNTSMWFEWYSTVNQRVMINSGTINPMNDKHGHRWLVQPKGMEVEVNVERSDDGVTLTNKDGKDISGETRYALAQAFGMAVDKKNTSKIDEFGEALLTLDEDKVSEMKASLLKDGSYKFGDHEAEVEHIGHVLQGIKFLEDSLKGKKVTTKLSAEFDAVTSGFGLKLLQMPIINNLTQYLSKVGVVIPSKGAQSADSMNDLLDSEGFLDNYETLASQVKVDKEYREVYQDADNLPEFEGKALKEALELQPHNINSKFWGSLKGVLPKALGDEVSKELRNLFKDPFMTFNYSRSINNIKKGLASNVVEDIISKLAKTPMNKLTEEQQSILRAINVVTGNKHRGAKGVREMLRENDLESIKVGKGNLKDYMESFVSVTYGEAVSDVFYDQFGEFIDAQDRVTNAFKYAYEVFDYEYKKRLDRARKLEGKLDSDMKKEVLRDLLEVFPLIDGPMSESFKTSMEVRYLRAKDGEVDGNFDDGSLSVFKETRQRGDDILGTQFAMKDGGSKTINPRLKTFAAPGVGGSVLPIHSIDAAILLNTFLDEKDMVLIHDAIIPRLDNMNESVKQYNRHVMEINEDYSFISSVNDMVKRVENFTNTVEDRKRSTKIVDWRPEGAEKDDKFTLMEMQNSVVMETAMLANTVQNKRSTLYNDIKNDPDAKFMHMAGMKDGVYSLYEDDEKAINDEIRSEYSDTIADMLDNLQTIINKPCK